MFHHLGFQSQPSSELAQYHCVLLSFRNLFRLNITKWAFSLQCIFLSGQYVYCAQEKFPNSFFSKSIPCVWHLNFIFRRNLGICRFSKSRLQAIFVCYKPMQLPAADKEILVVNLQRSTFGKNSAKNMHATQVFYPAKRIAWGWNWEPEASYFSVLLAVSPCPCWPLGPALSPFSRISHSPEAEIPFLRRLAMPLPSPQSQDTQTNKPQ